MRRPRIERWAAAALIGAAACAPAPVPPAAASCSPDRTVLIASQADVRGLAGCTTVRGVTLRTGAVVDVAALRALTSITGDLVIGPTVAIEQVVLGELRRVDGTIHVFSNGMLQGLYLPRLGFAGRVDIDGNPVLTAISLPRLASVGGELRITDNAGLELVDVSALATIGGTLVVAGAPRLALIETQALQRAAGIELDAPNLDPDVADRVRAAGAAR